MRTDTAIFVEEDESMSIKFSKYENGSGIIHLKIGHSDINLFVKSEAQFIAIRADHNIKAEK